MSQVKEAKSKKFLWFVNFGGYDINQLKELHDFGLIVAKSRLEARKIGEKKFLCDCKKQHKDDIRKIYTTNLIDDCQAIDEIGSWQINLIKDPKGRSQVLKPDWYGFLRIDQ